MTLGLKVSLIFNLGLASVLTLILVQRRTENGAAAASPVSAAQSSPAPVQTKPFQWSELESTNDYRNYVANLRAVGCPEPTVEDIVWGDAERVFSAQRRQLNLSGDEAGPWSKQKETRLVAYFLGQTVTAGNPDENPAKAAPDRRSTPAVYPLAFRDVNLDALGLTDAQKQAVQQAIAGIRQQFITQIGGVNQDPSDPAYFERWRKAQAQNDVALRGWLGNKTFMAYQLAIQANSATTTQNP